MSVTTATPILDALIRNGDAWREDNGDVVGRAADGKVVCLGYDYADAERYLVTHPTPDTW